MSEHVHKPGDPRVFVFGSNLDGDHAGGAAAYAARHCGAKMGIGQGLVGGSYALPTCSKAGVPLTLESVRTAVAQFIEYAYKRLDLTFFVSEVGCGIAGFKPADIAPMFDNAPSNCDLPPGWRPRERAIARVLYTLRNPLMLMSVQDREAALAAALRFDISAEDLLKHALHLARTA